MELSPAAPRIWIGLGILLLATALAFGPSLTVPFIQDDWGVIVENPDLKADNLPALAGRTYWARELPFDDPWRPGHQLYRPLPVIMFALEKELLGLRAWAFRITNLLLHWLVSGTLMLLTAELLGGWERAWRAALFGGLLFALHAVHFEPVVHIVGRAELGMSLATLAALLCVRPAAGDARWLVLALGLGVLATLFKEQGALAPLPVLLYAVVRPKGERGSSKSLLCYSAGALLWAGLYWWLRTAAIGGYQPLKAGQPLADFSFWERSAVMAAALVEYARLLLFPADSLLDYRHHIATAPTGFLSPPSLLGIGLAAGAVGLLIRGVRRRAPAATLGAALIVVGLGPVSNLWLPIGAVMAERFLYLPSAGFCLLLAALLRDRLRSGTTLLLLAGVLLLMLTLCWRHSYYFHDPVRLAAHLLRQHGDKPRLLHLAALMFEKAGRLAEAEHAWQRQKLIEAGNPTIDIHLSRLSLRRLQHLRPPDSPAALEARLDRHLMRLEELEGLGDAPLLRGAIRYLRREFDRARLEFLEAAFQGSRSLSSRREAAAALLQMEQLQLGTTRLPRELVREAERLADASRETGPGVIPFSPE